MADHIDPTRAQFSAMMKLPDDGPIHMLNLIKLKDWASYEDARRVTGTEAYTTYGQESSPIFQRVGGRNVHSWEPKLVVIGPDDEAWDVAFIAEYLKAEAFGEMVKDPDYQKAVIHRQAAVETSRLIRLHPKDSGSVFGE